MARMKNVSTKVDDKRKTMPHLVKKGQVLNPKGSLKVLLINTLNLLENSS